MILSQIDLDGLRDDVLRHVYGDCRCSSRRLSADNPASVEHCTRSDELDPDCLFDRRNHLYPAHGISDAVAYNAMAFYYRGFNLYTRIDRVRRQ